MNYDELLEKGEKKLKEVGIKRRGAETGATLKINHAFFNTMRFKLNLIDSLPAKTDFEIFGCKLKTPVMAAALSSSPGQEKITTSPLAMYAEGMKAAGSLMMVGISSNKQLESVVDTGVPTVKIIKPYKDHDIIFQKIEHAEQTGVKAVGIDIDYILAGKLKNTVSSLADSMGPKTSRDLKDFISSTKLPFILKGILGKKDAEKAVDLGAKCIVVSNHGGSVLDYSAHPLEVLPEIKTLVGDKVKVLVDGEIRRGTDVLKALALGADGVLVGWLLLIALAANISDGVRDIVKIMTEELKRAMTLTGCRTLKTIDSSILERSEFTVQL
jgi:isopentenyl diphosphate isomerase/L-lactate dehydrogenase-like FMN-dependent dehydrogenase